MAESYSREYEKASSQLESFDEIVFYISFANDFAETFNVSTAIQLYEACCKPISSDRLRNQTQDKETNLNLSHLRNRRSSLRQVDLALAAQELIAIHRNDFDDHPLSQHSNKAYLTQECTIAFASHKAIFKRDSQGSNKISCEVASWTARKCCEVLQTIPPTMEMMRHAVLLRVKARFALRSATLHSDLDTRTAYTALTLAAGQSGGMLPEQEKSTPLKLHSRKVAYLGSFVRDRSQIPRFGLCYIPLDKLLMSFRDHLPPNCPLEDAVPPTFKVYYLVGSDPPGEKDFLSTRERRPDANKMPTPSLECRACGISVFTDIEGTELARNVSKSLRKKKTAIGNLTPDLGLIKNTPSDNTGDTHHTFWPYKDAEPWLVFQVIGTDEQGVEL